MPYFGRQDEEEQCGVWPSNDVVHLRGLFQEFRSQWISLDMEFVV